MNTFNPENISITDMKLIADHIENYVEVLTEVMYIPDEIIENKKCFKKALVTTKKLIRKLRKGKRSVFKDSDEWNSLS